MDCGYSDVTLTFLYPFSLSTSTFFAYELCSHCDNKHATDFLAELALLSLERVKVIHVQSYYDKGFQGLILLNLKFYLTIRETLKEAGINLHKCPLRGGHADICL